LKGLFRSLVETISNGCFGGKFDRRYKDKDRGNIDHSYKLPRSYVICEDPEKLCIACRIFGMLSGKKVFTGKVSFQDATCINPKLYGFIKTIDLMEPKPHHEAFYLDPSGKRIAGRKFYFHSSLKTKVDKTTYNQQLNPLKDGSEFIFNASFTNLETDEWQSLIYAIILEPEMRHKLGYAKPSGLGSVRIEITKIQLSDYSKRYTSVDKGISEYKDKQLTDYIATQIKSFTDNRTSNILNELRRIWRWDENYTTNYKYPSKDWFEKNPNARISKTP